MILFFVMTMISLFLKVFLMLLEWLKSKKSSKWKKQHILWNSARYFRVQKQFKTRSLILRVLK